MKKLNNKGYLLVEIIVACVLAFGVAYFLMNLTIKFSKVHEDVFQSVVWTNEKNILTNIIMEDIEKYTLLKIDDPADSTNVINFVYYDNVLDEQIEKSLRVSGHNVYYGDYIKEIDKVLNIGEFVFDVGENYTIIKLPIKSMYSDEDYSVKIFIPYSIETNSDTIVFDLSGNYNNATNMGASWDKTLGNIATNGTSSYVDCGLKKYDFDTNVTFATKLKFNTSSGGQYVFGNWDGGGGGLFVDASGILSFELYVDGGYRNVKASSNIAVGVWYNIIGVYDGSNIKLYVNGNNTSTSITTTDRTIKVSPAPIVLGGNPSVNGIDGSYANVTYDNVLLFDRVLTNTEIDSYNNGDISSIETDELLFYYDF